MPIKFTNFGFSTLAVGINSSVTTLNVAGGHGARFPTLGAGDYFYATLENAALVREIVKVTARSVDAFTIVRGQDNTTAAAWSAGDSVALRLNAAAMTDFVPVTAGAIQAQTHVAFTTAGTSTAYTLTPSPAITAYLAGQFFDVTFHAECGAAPTLQISGVTTPPNLVKRQGDGTVTNVVAGDIPVGTYRVRLLSATQAEVLGLWRTSAINAAPLLHLNDIVNGDFRIAQAGTTFAAPASGAYDLDGWQQSNTTPAVFTVAQVAGSTAGRLARQATITTAWGTVNAGYFVMEQTKIEGYNIEKYVGQTFTIAFRAKVPVTGIHCVALRNSGFDRSYIKEINFPTANVWQDCSFTVTGGLPTAGTWNYTNGLGLEIDFTHMAGTNVHTTPDAWQTGSFLGTANQVNDCATVGNVWAMEKVTMNLGTVAAVSEISLEQELVRCMRYFYRTTKPVMRGAFSSATAYVRAGANHPVLMRATPTVTIFGTLDIFDGTGTGTVTSTSAVYSTTQGFEADGNVATGTFVANRPAVFYTGPNTGGFDIAARL